MKGAVVPQHGILRHKVLRAPEGGHPEKRGDLRQHGDIRGPAAGLPPGHGLGGQEQVLGKLGLGDVLPFS